MLQHLRKADAVALTETSSEQVRQIEDDLAEVVTKLRKLRQDWADSKEGDIELEIDKAAGFVEYLKDTWIHRVIYQFNQGLPKARRKRTTEEAKNTITESKKGRR